MFGSYCIGCQDYISGGASSIADIRLASSLEFLPVIDYALPEWAQAFMSGIEMALGEAYSEPADDVRGYIQYAKSQAG